MKKNKELLVLTHLSQLLDFITGIGGLIVPLILWVVKKDEVLGMDEHGKSIINFRISMFLYILLCIPMVLFFGLGLLGFLIIGVFYFIFPIINAVKASNGEEPSYPFTIRFIS
ncbi:tRNA modification GTPase [Tenacibaculum sp. 190130A14a]|uniref:tRNA modification GTPase n=1 Tax=Tenacibaculum polynesiense TaxID=3137857 RepID=A0ABP1EYI2_9FLAO